MYAMKTLKLLLATLLLNVCSAEAASIQWSFSNALFNDGGSILGSFEFDADTSLYSNIAITTTAGTSFAGASYDETMVYSSSPEHLFMSFDNTRIWLAFTGPLTNAGGNIPLFLFGDLLSELQCDPSPCDPQSGGSVLRWVTDGSVTAPVQVALPGTAALFAWGVLCLGMVTNKVRGGKAA
jgi:hypothetical protein